MNIKIRRLEPDDANRGIIETLGHLSDIQLSAHHAKMLIMNFSTQSTIYVAEDENEQIVGTATLMVRNTLLHQGGRIAYLEEVATRSGYEGKGVASALIEDLVLKAKEKGCYKVILACKSELGHFYEKKSFKYDQILMRKDL